MFSEGKPRVRFCDWHADCWAELTTAKPAALFADIQIEMQVWGQANALILSQRPKAMDIIRYIFRVDRDTCSFSEKGR